MRHEEVAMRPEEVAMRPEEITEEQALLNAKRYLYEDLAFTGPILAALLEDTSYCLAQPKLDYMIEQYAKSLIAVRRHK